jgi:hypothetical protein
MTGSPDRRPTSPREAPPLEGAETEITGAERLTAHGAIWVGSARYPDVFRHGRAHVAAARAWDPSHLAWLARERRAAAIPPERWAFLDVESTGLGAHTGVRAFLVGIGWIAGDGVRIEQILLRDPDEEPALLAAVTERLAGFAGIVSFNGKAFDLPLLATRAALHRRAAPHVRHVHCDLLHVARRVWAERGRSCRLAALEARCLGLRREGDVESRLVPEYYHEYLRQGRGAVLAPVLAHNRTDLLSLALLTAEASRFLECVERPSGGRGRDPRALAADRLRAARVYLSAGETGRAAALLDACIAESPPGDARCTARSLLGRLRKRQGAWDAAREQWESLLGEAPDLVEPYEELAKVHEHRKRDPGAALAWVERRLAGPPLGPVAAASLARRRARLVRLAGRLGAPGLRPPDAGTPQGFPDVSGASHLEVWTRNC